MMTKLIQLLLLGLISAHAQASTEESPIHLPIDASRSQYEVLHKKLLLRVHPFDSPTPYKSLQPLVEVGRRNLQWLDYLNQHRSDPLAFSSKETQGASPIDSPNKYGPKTLLPLYESIKIEIPTTMRQVLFSNTTLPKQLPLDKQEYINWGRKVDKMYQFSVRWLTLSKWLDHYERRRLNDIRGYHFLSKMHDLDNTLRSWAHLDLEKKTELTPLLINLCHSGNSAYRSCKSRFNTSAKQNALIRYKSLYWSRAKRIYDGYFHLGVRRSDVTWNGAHSLKVLFRTPATSEIQNFLSDNIEDEWQLDDWNLKLDFKSNARINVVFKPNVVPQVDGLGGNRILMNSLESLDDYNVQWTIRHEFGHVLGFPDCYVEFYNAEEELMVNYQIDTSNLMCSRRGELQPMHLDELKRVYNIE